MAFPFMAAQDPFSMYGLRTPGNTHQSGMHQSEMDEMDEMDQMDQMNQGMNAFTVFPSVPSIQVELGIPDLVFQTGLITRRG